MTPEQFAALARAAEATTIVAIRRYFEARGPWKVRDPYAHEVQAVLDVGGLETVWGTAWRPPGGGSHNWGAMQAGKVWVAAGHPVFTYTDTHPNSDGTSTPYKTSFRAYPTDLEGCTDLVKWLDEHEIFAVLRSNRTVRTLSTALRAKGYYEGFGKTWAERVNHHVQAASGIQAKIQPILGPSGLALDGQAPPPERVIPETSALADVASQLAVLAAQVPLDEIRRWRHAVIGWDTDRGRFG